MRSAILTATRALAAEFGWTAVTLRRIAERIEYSPATVYEHFANKEAILAALADEGYAELAVSLRRASAKEKDGHAAMRAMAHAYWRFADRSPDMYQVMFELAGVSGAVSGDKSAAAHAAFALLKDSVESVAAAAGIRLADSSDEAASMWAAWHGLVSLTMSGRMVGGKSHAETLVESTTERLLAGMTARSA
ncbi:MAG: TetR/AcrR family transcriptional regulator [Chloroflexota bacterium]|nr:TetR/AcrR family transcriptional regulator [Chloroflexota bacterium]